MRISQSECVRRLAGEKLLFPRSGWKHRALGLYSQLTAADTRCVRIFKCNVLKRYLFRRPFTVQMTTNLNARDQHLHLCARARHRSPSLGASLKPRCRRPGPIGCACVPQIPVQGERSQTLMTATPRLTEQGNFKRVGSRPSARGVAAEDLAHTLFLQERQIGSSSGTPRSGGSAKFSCFKFRLLVHQRRRRSARPSRFKAERPR